MSSGKASRTMIELVDECTVNGPIIDLGSGWGTLVIPLARKYPHQQVAGYELSLFPWLVSVLAKQVLGLNNLTLYRQDFIKADLSKASLLCCYLFPGGMTALAEKFERDKIISSSHKMKIISNTFALSGVEPTKVVKLDDIYRTPIYVYSLPLKN